MEAASGSSSAMVGQLDSIIRDLQPQQTSSEEHPRPNSAPAPSVTPSKGRSFSDSTPTLEPSPRFKEPTTQSKDDDALIQTPSKAPGRAHTHARGLSLQMPARDPSIFSNASIKGRYGYNSAHDPRDNVYTSPSSVLPRHSRGMDFSRACTHLHHSTLAESSPDSSPTVTQKNFMVPSRRASTISMALDSPRISNLTGWPGLNGNGDRITLPRSVASTNALTSDASESSSDDEDQLMQDDDPEDAILTTPQLKNLGGSNRDVTPFNSQKPAPNNWTGMQSPRTPRDARQRRRRIPLTQNKRLSGGLFINNSTSSNQIVTTPGTSSNEDPPAAEHTLSRRDSLNLGTSGLHITSSNDSTESSYFGGPSTPGVVRRPVTRRSNLLPKSKNFARIRAQLQEESAPADNEVKREAEVVKQVRGSESGFEGNALNAMPTSPALPPTVPHFNTESSDLFALEMVESNGRVDQPKKPVDMRRGSMSKEFWPNLYTGNIRSSPPPPPLFHRTRSSSGISEDVSMGSPQVSTPPSSIFSAVSTHLADVKPEAELSSFTGFQPPSLPTAVEISRKASKRRRDEDFDISSIKRRAVSPGMSSQNSPVLGQSPSSNSGGLWGMQQKSNASRENSGVQPSSDDRASSTGTAGMTTPNLGPKRFGLQGMTDTNDGIMKMSIE